MRKVSLLIFTLCLALGLSGARLARAEAWLPQGSGTTATLNDVHFVATTGFAVGASGAIRKTTDEGNIWVSKSAPGVTAALFAVDSIGSTSVWAVGSGVAIRSTTGGDSWTNLPVTGGVIYTGVDMVTSTTGWRVGSGLDGVGVMEKTTTGGDTWTPQTLPPGTLTLRDIHCLTTSLCWAVGDSGTILKTDNGSTWTPQTSGVTVSLHDVHLLTSTSAMVVGDDGIIRRTTNGTTWTNPVAGGGTVGSGTDLRGLKFVATTVWVVGVSGSAFRSMDTGNSWTPLPLPGVTGTLEAVDFTITPKVWAVGASGVIRRHDSTPPFTPTGLTRTSPANDSTPTFSWTASYDDVAVAYYEGRFGSEPFVSVGLVTTYTVPGPLADGSWTLELRAVDTAGNVGSSTTLTFAIDATAPETTLTVGPPASTTGTRATFEFIATESSTFECRLDSGAYVPCTSPWMYEDLALGSHTFFVRATDGVLNVDATPASTTWTIVAGTPTDTTPPDTTITGSPAGTTTGTSATFVFTASEAATFECQLDGSAYSSCSSPRSYSGLEVGAHTFAVRATDLAGNIDATPASFSWSVTTGAAPPPLPPPGEPATPPGLLPVGFFIGNRVKLADDGNLNTFGDTALFYLGANGARYVFPNDKVYFTWYADFSGTKTISAAALASIPLRGNVTYRPGVKMVKLQTSPTVYVASRGGLLRAVPSEAIASALYGTDWNRDIDDVNDAFWTNYEIGTPLAVAADYSIANELSATTTVNDDKGLVIP